MALIDFVFTRAGEATRTAQNGLLATVPSNFPVVNFDDGDLLGYYSQRAATNLLQRSEEFDNAVWGKSRINAFGSGSVANTSDTVAPDGTQTADFIQQLTGETNSGGVFRNLAITNGTTYTLSVYAKQSTARYLRLGAAWGGADFCSFDLQNGVVAEQTTGNIARITSADNGWYRCSVTYTAAVTANRNNFIYQSTGLLGQPTTPDTGIFIWGAQLELGSEATSYIKTVDTAVTRNKDVATASGLTLSPLSNVQFKANFPTDYPLVIAGLQATVSGYKTIRLELSPTEKTLFVDGVEADTDTGSYDWSGITSIELGHFDGGEQPNFEIADLRINE
jgi:hypothetical protein